MKRRSAPDPDVEEEQEDSSLSNGDDGEGTGNSAQLRQVCVFSQDQYRSVINC